MEVKGHRATPDSYGEHKACPSCVSLSPTQTSPVRCGGDSLAGTPVLGAAPSDGGGGDERCSAGEYVGVRGGNMCAQGKVFGLERVCDSPMLGLGALCKPACGAAQEICFRRTVWQFRWRKGRSL